MAVTSGFFNSVNHDRLYDADQFSSIMDGVISDGVFKTVGNALNVTPYTGSNSTVLVDTGRAWFDHTWTVNDSILTIEMDPPNRMLQRIDAVVIDINKETNIRKNSIIYVKGNDVDSTGKPILINTDNHKQYPICYITRPAGEDALVDEGDISMAVGTEECPYVTGVMLTDDEVSKLQDQIDDLRHQIESGGTGGESSGLLDAIVSEAFKKGDFNVRQGSFYIPVLKEATPTDPNKYNTVDVPGLSGATILPNGKIAIVSTVTWSKYGGSVDTIGGYKLAVGLFTKDGAGSWHVLENSAFDLCDYGVFQSAGYQIDSFPVVFNYVYMSNGTVRGNDKVEAFHCKITINSDDTISVYCSPNVESNNNSAFKNGTATGNLCTSLPTTSGSYLCALGKNVASGSNPAGCVWKLTSDGAFTGGVVTSRAFGRDDKYSGLRYYACIGESGRSIAYVNNTRWTAIDENTLVATDHSDDLGYTPIIYKNLYPAEVYSVSESSGVSMKSAVLNHSYTEFSSEKISPYYLGASNLMAPLPEGDISAINDDGTLYAIGPSGEKMIIGSNGGTAIFKNKVSAANPISLDNVIRYCRGYVTDGTYSLYLLNSQNTALGAGTVSATETSSQKLSVYYIERS